jgi:hypothetical protein
LTVKLNTDVLEGSFMRFTSKACSGIAFLLLTVPLFARTYNTSFPATENPICEGSPCNWIGGQTAGGNLWGNVQTTSGFAFGVTQPTTFGDPTAILTGTWGSNQTAQATVKITGSLPGVAEVELRLRNTVSANSITGYEAYCSVVSGNPYCHIARWNGPNGQYCNIASGPQFLANNDVIKATVADDASNNPVITMYRLVSGNWNQLMSVIDTGNNSGGDPGCGSGKPQFHSGSPGIGFYTSGSFNNFGLSNFMATDGSITVAPPTGLTGVVH